ncbi:hypothetical protein A9W98_06635 [Mycobacterium gordonae]|jgi:hypothetical protein|uniref:Uncharacterized protein n=2 Tax=Mycobacterium TaxID=1763 RepID=A0ABY3V1E0_MYCLN|nr:MULTISPECIES: hypothetical protein [Mycobacterium]OBS04036.1 hypothetical protein A9W98_06635 [Mycobacterium gordonae]UCN13094.1 hypothetical protein LFT50_30880 [Mycobacterium intracellulare subsp. chimaera]ULP45618.1 hypothetical protein MJO58_28590 [Mycobacterium lentiflavum]
MTARTPHIDPEGLGAAIAAWQADVPAAVAYPELTAAPDDAATAAVLASIAHWPGEHTAMAGDRDDKATRFVNAASATTHIEVAADDDNGVRISSIEGVWT